jgi:hypothetical protein
MAGQKRLAAVKPVGGHHRGAGSGVNEADIGIWQKSLILSLSKDEGPHRIVRPIPSRPFALRQAQGEGGIEAPSYILSGTSIPNIPSTFVSVASVTSHNPSRVARTSVSASDRM